MYESPIDIAIGKITTELKQAEHDYIVRSVRDVGINVDEAELIKALEYDRKQYEKGYADAMKEYENCISFNDLKDIIMNTECQHPESEFLKGYILGSCIKWMEDKKQQYQEK